MPQSRTYDPSAGDPIGDAIRAALGEQVRPREPGKPPAAADAPAPPSPPRPRIAAIGTYTFTSVPRPTPPDPDAGDEADDA